MKISTTHKRFADNLRKPEALEKPQDFLGPNTTTVINFWLYLDTLSQDQWETVAERYLAARNAACDAAGDAARNAAWYAAGNAAWYAAGYDAGYDAGYAAAYAAWNAAWDAARDAAAYATYELIGSHILIEQGKSLFFVPMFDFGKEEGIDFSKIRPKYIMVSTPTTSCQIFSNPETTRRIFPMTNPCLEIEMPQV